MSADQGNCHRRGARFRGHLAPPGRMLFRDHKGAHPPPGLAASPGFSAFREKSLAQYNHNPIPVAPKHKEIEGKKVYQTLEDIPEKIDTITIYLGPARQEAIIKDIVRLAPKRVIFNPDTENQKAYEQLKEAGIKVVEACTLVLLKTSQY